MTTSRTTLFSVAVAAGLTLGGCAGESGSGQSKPPDTPVTVWDVSIAEQYDSIADLTASSSHIVEGCAASSEEIEVHGVPFTITSFKVKNYLKGDGGDVRNVRQFGTQKDVTEFLAPSMTVGECYILYLEPFEMQPGEDTAEDVVLGTGALQVEGRTAYFPEQAKEFKGLPEAITLEQIEDATR